MLHFWDFVLRFLNTFCSESVFIYSSLKESFQKLIYDLQFTQNWIGFFAWKPLQ